ncbi:cytochrome c551 peroxidase [Vibrio maritimus]|uniref:Cytochrome c551 peroxidase n=1 Tax=Vibrio maritimus TaxID=990268 RepID=A0A090RS11_9VIBR|nr:cytochrome c551 peroxidase [Vibrio maritimus]
MGATSWEQIIEKLSTDQEMQELFAANYDGEISEHTITHAIAEFEKTLVTPNSPFDQYLAGNTSAISETAKEGFALFKEYKCDSCHTGEALGGGSFEVMGLKADYFASRGGDITEADLGRYNVTGSEHDRHRFKVPTLRNVELKAPFFHDGTAETLEDAVYKMAKYQVGVELNESEVSSMTEFLKTLTGEYRGKPLS